MMMEYIQQTKSPLVVSALLKIDNNANIVLIVGLPISPNDCKTQLFDGYSTHGRKHFVL